MKRKKSIMEKIYFLCFVIFNPIYSLIFFCLIPPSLLILWTLVRYNNLFSENYYPASCFT